MIVSKNTILAFFLIFLTIMFFNSPFYNKFYEKTFKKQRNIEKVINNQVDSDSLKSKNIPLFDTLKPEKKVEIKQKPKTVSTFEKEADSDQIDTAGVL